MIVTPFAAGAVHVTTRRPSPRVATTFVGTPGIAVGVTDADGAEAADAPTAFVALTENVYAVPLVRPVTVQVVAFAPLTVHVRPPGAAVAV